MIYKILVRGRVQGVNFRKMVKAFADKNDLKGTVRNLDDGQVEVFVECSAKEKGKLIGWIKESPGFSKVEGVEIEKLQGEKGFEEFKVVRDKGFFEDQRSSFKSLGKKILKL